MPLINPHRLCCRHTNTVAHQQSNLSTAPCIPAFLACRCVFPNVRLLISCHLYHTPHISVLELLTSVLKWKDMVPSHWMGPFVWRYRSLQINKIQWILNVEQWFLTFFICDPLKWTQVNLILIIITSICLWFITTVFLLFYTVGPYMIIQYFSTSTLFSHVFVSKWLMWSTISEIVPVFSEAICRN